MTKARASIGSDGKPLPILPPDRDGRVWAKTVRVMFYTPGFLALLLIKAGEPAGFGITVELLMLASAAAVIAGLFVGAQAVGGGADNASKVGTASGSLIIELLSAIPFLCAVPALFHQLAHSTLLHTGAPGSSIDVPLGLSELLPAIAVIPFMLYQLAGFGTLTYIVPKLANWIINVLIFVFIVTAYYFNRTGQYDVEKRFVVVLILGMAIVTTYGIMRLKKLQAEFDARAPVKGKKDDE